MNVVLWSLAALNVTLGCSVLLQVLVGGLFPVAFKNAGNLISGIPHCLLVYKSGGVTRNPCGDDFRFERENGFIPMPPSSVHVCVQTIVYSVQEPFFFHVFLLSDRVDGHTPKRL